MKNEEGRGWRLEAKAKGIAEVKAERRKE